MIYEYDNIDPLPIRDLYNSNIMLAAINAAKDQYDTARQDLKDFKKEYGNFYSPSNVDMATYNKEFNVSKFVSDLYAQGIDPLRSAEGRALVDQYISSRPYDWYNNAKQTAEVGQIYNKAVAELDAKGMYNPEMETKYLKHDISNWDSSKGSWNRMSPSVYKDIDTLLEPIVKNVDYSYDDALTKEKNDGNDYYTISKERLMQAVDDNMSDILSTPQGGYHYWKAMQATGNDKNKAMQLLREQIANRLSDNVKEKKEVDPWKMARYKNSLDMAAYANKAAIDHKYHELETDAAAKRKADEDRNHVSNIFRNARDNITDAQKIAGVGGQPAGYIPNESYYQYIDPIGKNWAIDIDDKGNVSYRLDRKAVSGNSSIIYSPKQINGTYLTTGGTYNKNHMRRGVSINSEDVDEYYFDQNGAITAKWDPINKRCRYFVGGTLSYISEPSSNGEKAKSKYVTDDDNNNIFFMEVTEREDNYGEKNR